MKGTYCYNIWNNQMAKQHSASREPEWIRFGACRLFTL